jgi:hypothetical protein
MADGGDQSVARLKALLEEADDAWMIYPIFLSVFSGDALREIVAEVVDSLAQDREGELPYRCRVGNEWVETDDRDKAIESQLLAVREVAEKYNLKPLLG